MGDGEEDDQSSSQQHQKFRHLNLGFFIQSAYIVKEIYMLWIVSKKDCAFAYVLCTILEHYDT